MKTYEGKMVAKDIRIGIVVARFNEFITSKLLSGAVDALTRHDVSENSIDVAWVPGAFEIPIVAKKMAQSGMASYTSMIVPGVFAQTGMESCEIIQGIVQQTSPDCIITIDALAARSAFRLGTTVQLTDTGIRPGSGVGNARKGITKENMKIPVIAIGIPTVVSAAAIVSDAMDSLKQIGYNETILGSIAMLDKEEYYQLISEVFAPELGSLFVMPKNLDEELDTMSSLLAASLSQVICKR